MKNRAISYWHSTVRHERNWGVQRGEAPSVGGFPEMSGQFFKSPKTGGFRGLVVISEEVTR